MARSLWMYGKKRGHRRTGSRTWGSAGEALFFGFFLLLGSVFLAGLFHMLVVPEWRVNHNFVETRAGWSLSHVSTRASAINATK